MGKYDHQIKLICFAKEHGYIITPLGWGKHILQYEKLKHCPCDYERPECPCQEAIQEISDKGHCKCSLFWQNYDRYLEACYPDDYPPK